MRPPRHQNDRQIAEMLGLAKGIICDGTLNAAEVVALKQWFAANPDVLVHYPGNLLGERVLEAMADGVVDEEEMRDLAELLSDLTGEPLDGSGTMNEPARLPLDDPPPTLIFDNREYVFTGIFAWGTRERCQKEVTDRGGRCGGSITNRTDVLVVGLMGSPDWKQSTHGRKIEQAVALREQGRPIHIVGEEHWIDALQMDAR